MLYTDKVVIPIQTISFYNSKTFKRMKLSDVVIPIQTISFYNSKTAEALKSQKMLSYLSKR